MENNDRNYIGAIVQHIAGGCIGGLLGVAAALLVNDEVLSILTTITEPLIGSIALVLAAM